MKPEAIRKLVDMLIEAASEHGEAMEVNRCTPDGPDNRHGMAVRNEVGTRMRVRALRDALLVALGADDPTETVPF